MADHVQLPDGRTAFHQERRTTDALSEARALAFHQGSSR